MATTTTTVVSPEQILWFISMYNRFEKMPIPEGCQEIRFLFRDEASKASHLCDKWRWKKRVFGSFYLNLDYPSQMRFLHRWEIKSEEDSTYLDQYHSDHMAPLFLDPPANVKVFHNVILYFENHGINEWPSKDIQLEHVPAMRFRFGNTRNWARYILSLPVAARLDLVGKIAAHYQKEKV